MEINLNLLDVQELKALSKEVEETLKEKTVDKCIPNIKLGKFYRPITYTEHELPPNPVIYLCIEINYDEGYVTLFKLIEYRKLKDALEFSTKKVYFEKIREELLLNVPDDNLVYIEEENTETIETYTMTVEGMLDYRESQLRSHAAEIFSLSVKIKYLLQDIEYEYE